MRYSTRLGFLLVVFSIFICILLIDARIREETYINQQAVRNRFQSIVGLPDLAITTAARYLRHYSLSDLATPFQDHPVSQEHFPASFSYAPPNYSNMPGRISLIPLKQRDVP